MAAGGQVTWPARWDARIILAAVWSQFDFLIIVLHLFSESYEQYSRRLLAMKHLAQPICQLMTSEIHYFSFLPFQEDCLGKFPWTRTGYIVMLINDKAFIENVVLCWIVCRGGGKWRHNDNTLATSSSTCGRGVGGTVMWWYMRKIGMIIEAN